VRQHLIEEANSGGLQVSEVQYRRCDGKPIWVRDVAQVHRDTQGNVQYIDGTLEDITERKQAEIALQESEERYRRLFEYSPDGIHVKYASSKGPVIANDAFAKMLGYEKGEDLVGLVLFDFIHPDYVDLNRTRDKRVADERKSNPFVYQQLIRKDGKVIDVEVASIPITLNGEPAIQVIVRDVTEQRRVFDLVERAKQEWEVTVDSLPQAVCLLDSEKRILRGNRTIAYWTMTDVQSLQGQPMCSLFEGETGIRFREAITAIWNMLLKGEDARFEFEDEDKFYDVQLRPVTHSSFHENLPRDTFAVMVIDDITSYKQMENTLRQLNADLEDRVNERTAQLAAANERLQEALQQEKAISEFRAQFSSMISHEFRTPLTLIKTSNDLLDRYADRLSQQQRTDIPRKIRAQVNYLDQLIDDILTVSKGETVGVELELRSVNLHDYCIKLIEDARDLIEPTHVLKYEVADCANVFIDERLMRQLVMNLLTNAAKYSPMGTTIFFRQQCDGSKFTLSVQDEGIGIPPEEQAQLFDTFYRANNVAGVAGSGIGLALVKLVTELHHGTVEVKSEIGQGTTFIVRVPVQPPLEVNLV